MKFLLDGVLLTLAELRETILVNKYNKLEADGNIEDVTDWDYDAELTKVNSMSISQIFTRFAGRVKAFA